MAPSIECAPTPEISTVSKIPIKSDKEDVFTWEQVVYFVSTNQIKKIHRNQQVQTVYNQWMKDTLADYGTIENYLLKTKLQFPSKGAGQVAGKPPVIILPNDFPYSVEHNIDHILIWSQEPLEKLHVQDILEERYGSKSWEWVYFVNPPEIQSVRKLPHVHVFMRCRQ